MRYHGWKFDVDGQCVKHTERSAAVFRKVRAKAYKVREMCGPDLGLYGISRAGRNTGRALFVPEADRTVTIQRGKNWLQGLETT